MKYTVLNYWKRFLVIGLIFAALFSTAAAGAWEMDTNFGINGVYNFPTGVNNSTIRSMAVMPNERIVLVGYSSDGPHRHNRFPTIEKLLPNGTPDPSFGNGQGIIFPFTGEFESVAVQADGKILIAGTAFSRGDTGSRYLVMRCNPDGTVDTSFNGTGLINDAWERRSKLSYADEILLRPDGKIIVAGSSKANVEIFAAAQYNPDGSPDASFGTLGKIFIPGGRHVDSALLQPDGKILLGGLSNFTLVRLLPDGALDTSFGNGGISFQIFGGYCELKSMKLQPDGKIVATGYIAGMTLSESKYVIARYNSNGTRDQSFPVIQEAEGADIVGGDVLIQQDGKIVLVGRIATGPYQRFLVYRYYANGLRDVTWNFRTTQNNQGVPLPYPVAKVGAVVRLQQGKILVAGGTTVASHVAFRLGNPLDSFDFDGDGMSDVSCFRPSDSTWRLLISEFGSTSSTHWGLPTDTLVPADFDGDGKTNIAVFRDGAWKIVWYDQTYHNIVFGQTGDIPRPGDFDGDGISDVAVYRPSNGNWYWLNSSNGQLMGLHFGISTDFPIIADFDGDKKSDIALYRQSNSNWLYLESTTGRYIAVPFGIPGDTPVPEDFDGDKKTDMAVFNDQNGYWHRRLSSTGQVVSTEWGTIGDIPAAADYNGDKKADLAYFRPSDSTWYIRFSATSSTQMQFCQAGDRPLASVFLP